jgi:DNA-directed RNA polymerase subunit RPC12/RpoP
MITFTCPKCRAELEVSSQRAGGQVTCPECRGRVQVPSAAPARKKPEPTPEARPASRK